MTNYRIRYQDYLRNYWQERETDLYLVAAAPKSGSTFIASVIGNLVGQQLLFAGDVPDRSEQKPNDIWLREKNTGKVTGVIHQHIRHGTQTEVFLQELGIRTLVTVRNLPDTLVSVSDHLKKVNNGNWPWGFVDASLLAQDESLFLDFLVDHIAGWYLAFYCGWQNAAYPIVQYSEFFSDPGNIRKVPFLSEITDDQIENAISQISPDTTRFNVGVKGRGLQKLTGTQIDRLSRLARHYGHYDLSPLGFAADGRIIGA